MQRFIDFDLSKGIPYRELVGSLLWIVLCVMGTELPRVKDLARRSNEYTIDDYNVAVLGASMYLPAVALREVWKMSIRRDILLVIQQL